MAREIPRVSRYDDEDYLLEDEGPRRPSHRDEELFVSEAYRIFMLAGMPDVNTRDRNHISVRPFHSLPPEAVASLRDRAKPWTEETSNACDIQIRMDDKSFNLELVDGYSKVTSRFPVSELDAEVRGELLYKIRLSPRYNDAGQLIDPWEKYTATAPAAPKKPGGPLSL